jgi:poly(beta-D-mannuronate) lyase
LKFPRPVSHLGVRVRRWGVGGMSAYLIAKGGIRRAGLAGVVVAAMGAAIPAGAGDLKLPFDVEVQRAVFGQPMVRSYCAPPAEPVVDLVMSDEAVQTRIKELLVGYQRRINELTDGYVRSRPANPALAGCALTWLGAWADAGAMLGKADKRGQFLRKWALAPIAVGYLKIMKAPELDRALAKRAEDWIRRWGWAVRADWSTNTDAASRNNYQLYWAGWGVMAAAIAADDPELFRWSIDVARFAARQVRKDGSLGWAMAAGRKALYHHLLAIAPLVMMAETTAANGYDLYAEEEEAIHRLARFVLVGLDSPSLIAMRAGAPQVSVLPPDSEDLAWLIPYAARFPREVPERWLGWYRHFDNRLLGGDLLLLFGRERTAVAAG